MKKILFATGCLLISSVGHVSAAPTASSAQPVCLPKTVIITQLPTQVSVIQFNPILVGPACTDPGGHDLTLTSVTSPATLAYDENGNFLNALKLANTFPGGSSVVITYTATNGIGGTVTSTVTVKWK